LSQPNPKRWPTRLRTFSFLHLLSQIPEIINGWSLRK
jgi:hypothetical protein